MKKCYECNTYINIKDIINNNYCNEIDYTSYNIMKEYFFDNEILDIINNIYDDFEINYLLNNLLNDEIEFSKDIDDYIIEYFFDLDDEEITPFSSITENNVDIILNLLLENKIF